MIFGAQGGYGEAGEAMGNEMSREASAKSLQLAGGCLELNKLWRLTSNYTILLLASKKHSRR